MKRKGMKIASLILTIISFLIILFSYVITILIFISINNMPPAEQGMNGAGFLLFILFIMIVAISLICFELSGACIIMNSIDLHKTKNEGNSIKVALIFLITNIFIFVMEIAYFPLLKVWSLL